MKQRISFIAIAIGMCYFYPHQSYGQKQLITSSSTANNFKRLVNEKAAIVNYLEKKSNTGNVSIFQFDQAILRDSIFFLDVLPGTSLKVVKDEISKRGENDFSINCHIQGAASKEGSLVLVYLDGELSGNLNYKFKNYAINPLGRGKFAIYEIDFKKFPVEDAPAKFNNYDKGSNDSKPGNPELKTSALIAPICAIRVLVAFTPNAELNVKNILGYSSMRQFINQAIAETNQAYINSQVNFRVELATSIRVPYTESGDYDTDLNRFQTPGDGYMDKAQTYRNLFSADVCVLIFNNSAYCGLASTIQATASSAFCEVHYDCVLGYYSFAHEISHLFGCRHNPETDPSSSPFAYGHGYVNSAAHWRTIMAYNLTGETRLQYFSNPNVTYGGVAMGTSALSYNAKVLNVTAGTVGAFRTPSATLALNSTGSVINDEKADATSTTSIVLQPGFQVINSEFRAYIKDCIDVASSLDNNYVNKSLNEAEDSRLPASMLSIYPNPTNGIVRIAGSLPGLENARIIINDQLGREAYRFNNNSSSSIKLNVSHLSSGMYYINITTKDKTISKKLVIAK